jgi:hypothetical protein
MGEVSSPSSPLAALAILDNWFNIIPQDVVVEEQMLGGFRAGLYCPVSIGEVYASSTAKLGFRSTSTVWLTQNLQ